jgi:hypothetical protein
VADDQHQWREVPGQPDAAQEAADARDLFFLAEARARLFGSGNATGFAAFGSQL